MVTTSSVERGPCHRLQPVPLEWRWWKVEKVTRKKVVGLVAEASCLAHDIVAFAAFFAGPTHHGCLTPALPASSLAAGLFHCLRPHKKCCFPA